MKPTLIVLAAGMGSRFGSLKQLEVIGPGNETIIDYTVYDAIQTGYGKIVFVIRKEFFEDFKSKVSDKFKNKIHVAFAFQDVNVKIPGIDNSVKRKKPWGTAHAVLVAEDHIDSPFAVVNADDYYGRNALKTMADFLKHKVNENHFAMVGYELSKTLSKNGSVSRGICETDENRNLLSVVERKNIFVEKNKIVFAEEDLITPIEGNQFVSMNLWGFHPSIFKHLKQYFEEFVLKHIGNEKAEFFIPLIVNDLIQKKISTVKVLSTLEQWYGITYKEDKPVIKEAIEKFVQQNKYPCELWSKE